MAERLEIVEFIRKNPDWERILLEKPYGIAVSRDEMFGRRMVLLKYNQVESDFSHSIVRECRGLILDEDTLEPICVPFFKFGNYMESYCPEIDWGNCWIEEKLDGSLIKMVKMGSGELLISTNGTIDAFKAPLAEQMGCAARSFGELAVEGMGFYGLDVKTLSDRLLEGYTYMFELTSPFNRVVVPWKETKLTFLGARDNGTLKEIFYGNHPLSEIFETPRLHQLKTLEDCLKATSEMGSDEEGFVVCDGKFNRVKVKSPMYVSLHAMSNNHIMSYERGLDIVRSHEQGEVLTYFPEFKDTLDEIERRYEETISDLDASWDGFLKTATPSAPRKVAAEWILGNFRIPGVGFSLLDSRVKNAREWMDKQPSSSVVRMLGFKER